MNLPHSHEQYFPMRNNAENLRIVMVILSNVDIATSDIFFISTSSIMIDVRNFQISKAQNCFKT